MLAFRRLVPHSRDIKIVVFIRVEGITDEVTDLLNLGLEPVVVAVVRVLDTVV